LGGGNWNWMQGMGLKGIMGFGNFERKVKK
jgi:hypothetical protein